MSAQMTHWTIRCSACGGKPEDDFPDYCASCGNPLTIELDYTSVQIEGVFDRHVTTLWKYSGLYPLLQKHAYLSLGEGGTPLVRTERMGEVLDIPNLWCKLDYLNPSGSFKDRGVVLGVARAVESGAGAVVCASSGNAAGSAVTYAARAGLPAVIFVPEHTPAPKLTMALAYGAQVFRVRGNYSHAFDLARQVARRTGWANVTTTYVNPFAVEGNKSVAYELFEQMDGVPDWVLIPVSAGPLLYGVWKGFEELRRFGLIDRIPRLAALQPEGCAPIARAFAGGEEQVREWDNLDTVVSGLSDPLTGYAGDGTLTLRMMRKAGGVALAVPDGAILAAARSMASREGIFTEPAGATAVAGAAQMRREGIIAPGERVVCLLTGHGLKQPVVPEGREAPLVGALDEVLQMAGIESK